MKKTNKVKFIAALLAAAMTALSASGCGETGDNTGDVTASETEAQTENTAETSENTDSTESDTSESSAEESSDSTAESVSEETDSGISTLFDPNFSIETVADGIKKVTDGDGRELILVSDKLSEVPEEYADSIVIRTPVKRAVFLSSTQVCTFRTADKDSLIASVAGVVGAADTWNDIPAIKEGVENGSIADVTGNTETGDPDYEKIAALDPDIVFLYTGDYGQQSAAEKLTELGINYAVDNEYLETDYMARMEWMRFILAFMDEDELADEIMLSAKENIDAAAQAVADLGEKSKAAVFSVYDGTVFPTAGNSWAANMLADMGAENVFDGMDLSTVTMESAFEKIAEADVIIYTAAPMYTPGLEAIKEQFPQLEECAAYASGRVWQYSDIFWNGIDQTDIMACDLAAVLYPETFDRDLTYYVKAE